MYVTSTDFRQNIGRYLDLCAAEDVYIMKHGEVFAKLVGATAGKRDSIRKMTGMLDFEKGTFGEEGEEMI